MAFGSGLAMQATRSVAALSTAAQLRHNRRTAIHGAATHHMIRRILASQQAGLVLVIVLLGLVLTVFAGTHVDRAPASRSTTSSTRTR